MLSMSVIAANFEQGSPVLEDLRVKITQVREAIASGAQASDIARRLWRLHGLLKSASEVLAQGTQAIQTLKERSDAPNFEEFKPLSEAELATFQEAAKSVTDIYELMQSLLFKVSQSPYHNNSLVRSSTQAIKSAAEDVLDYSDIYLLIGDQSLHALIEAAKQDAEAGETTPLEALL